MSQTAGTVKAKNMELATFYVGQALCGINILNIQEINRHFEVTTVPQSPDYVKGILNLRGRIVTILDLGKKLGLSQIQESTDNRNIIVRSGEEHIGLMVDSISDVVSFGVAPALVMFLWSLSSFGQVGWVACFLYLGCTAIRLARYNVQVSTVEKTHFQGLPSPMAAFMLCGLMLIFND